MKAILFGQTMIEVAPEILDIGLQWNEERDGQVKANHFRDIQFFHGQVTQLKNPVVVDVGASVGNYSIAAALHPGTMVYAFEPNPRVIPLFKKQVKLNNLEDRITLLPYGLWHREGSKTLLAHPRLARSGSATFGQHPHRDEWDKIAVEVRKLDSFAHLWPNGVDIIKLDAEGAEWFVLRGGRKVIKGYHPSLLMEHVNTRLFDYKSEDLIDTLKSWGYKNFHKMGIDIWVTK